jgi:hypothetical protein
MSGRRIEARDSNPRFSCVVGTVSERGVDAVKSKASSVVVSDCVGIVSVVVSDSLGNVSVVVSCNVGIVSVQEKEITYFDMLLKFCNIV